MKHVLLIEDDPFIIDIYNTKLKKEGFSVEVAVNGKEALKKIKEKKPDLILLDIVLSQATGFEFLEEVKGMSKLEKTPVIILSNLSQKRDVEKGLQMGAVKYLIKAHYTPSEVVKEVKEVLKLNYKEK
jgi:DNA-binding response OmpR family regulator